MSRLFVSDMVPSLNIFVHYFLEYLVFSQIVYKSLASVPCPPKSRIWLSSKINKRFTFTLQQKKFGEYSKMRLHKELSPILIPATKKRRYEERVGLLEKWHFLIFLSAVVIFGKDFIFHSSSGLP